jgi:hypothetical protein
MLFDLKGRRRRVVQVVYLTLAVLMGGGLVFFGIGSDVSGGLFDAFKDESGGNGNSVIEERVQSAERRLAANPRDEAALKAVVRGRYQIAGQSADPNTFKYTAEGKAQLAKAARAWERYLALEPEQPDVGLARYMVQAYSTEALNRAEEGAEAAEIVAEVDPSAQNYLALARYAQEAGQERKADLAGDQALELAKGKEKKAVKAQLKQIKQGGQAGGAAPQPQPQG